MAAVAAGINNTVFGEAYGVTRVDTDQYGNDTGAPLHSFKCVAVPLDKEFSQKLDGERLGVNFKGEVALMVPVIRFRAVDCPADFQFQDNDRLDMLDPDDNDAVLASFVVDQIISSSAGLITVRVSTA